MDDCNLFLFVRSRDTCALRVYKVNVPDNYEENAAIAKTYFDYTLTVKKLDIYSELKPEMRTRFSSFVFHGSYIYVFGGDQAVLNIEDLSPGLSSSDIYRLDVSNANNVDWELCGKMMVPRFEPGIVVYNNQYYIFGGMMKNQPYAEVYDTESGKSEVLPNPRIHVLSTKVMLVDNNGDPYVIAGSCNRDYTMAYHISAKYWQFYSVCESPFLNRGNPICVEINGEKAIYTYFKYSLRAFIVLSEDYFVAKIEGINEGFMDKYLEPMSLIHLKENKFCLVYVDGELYSVGVDKRDGKNVVIHVVVFDVFFTEINGVRKMRAQVSSNMNYVIEGNVNYEGAVRSGN